VSAIAIVYYNAMVAGLFVALGLGGALVTWRRTRRGSATQPDPMLHRP
jgi:hypothetical protein